MKVIFMGTPEFAVPVLRALAAEHEVVGVYTQQDREKGRGRKVEASPVKLAALELDLPVFQPKGFKKESVLNEMRALNADAIVVAAFGKILRTPVLTMTRLGCFNVHASLLPAYRGAAPVNFALLNGEKETGVTIMQMDEGLDTGDMLNAEATPIGPDDTAETLTARLSEMGAPLLLKTLREAECGTLHPVKQGETTTEYARMLDKEMGRIDFGAEAAKIERAVRAFDPWPAAYTELSGKTLKILKAEVRERPEGLLPGTVFDVNKKAFSVACGQGALRVLKLQLEGKKAMDTDAFLRGYRLEEGTVLG